MMMSDDVRYSCHLGERERDPLHFFQPPRADQMPDPGKGQQHDSNLDIH